MRLDCGYGLNLMGVFRFDDELVLKIESLGENYQDKGLETP